MIFDKYIDNPSGGSVYTNRNMYKQMYENKFNNLLVREMGTIKYDLYKANDAKDSHYVYVKVPSEVVPNFYYDVVIRLFTNNNDIKNGKNLRKYDVEFYSNDPAFVFSFAHSFKVNKLFIEDLSPKMAKRALKEVAKERNPKDDVWYVKSLYFAYLTMIKYNLFSKVLFSGCKPYNKKQLLNLIMNADEKITKRQLEAEKIRKEIAKEKEKNKPKPDTSKKPFSKQSTKISTVKTVKTSRNTNRVKTIKKK